ncbi:MAG TPA: PAS domain S-box protein [Mariprofundaceae bacterium]|nr:PAS domain S-box protein [Mariprofundaceae bacterium]
MRAAGIPDPAKLIETLPIGLVLCEMDGSLIYANEAFASIVGYSAEELMGLTYWDLTPKKYAAQEQAQFTELQESGRYGPYEKEYLHKGGGLVPVRLNGETVEVDGRSCIWSSVETIGDIRAYRQAVKKSEQRFRTLFESATDGLFLLSMDGSIVDVNEIGHARLGYTLGEMVGRNITEFDSPEFACRVKERIEQIKRNGRARFESAHVCRDGRVMPVEVSTRIIEIDGEPLCFSVIRDMTERKQMIDRVRERDVMYRAVFETTMDGFWVVDMEGRFLEVNDAYVAMSGYSREELLDMRIADVEARESTAETSAHLEKLMIDGHDRFESLHRRKSGEVWPVEIVSSFWDIRDGRIFVFIIDISERKETEARLQKLSEAVERGGEAVMITDADANIEYVNPAFTEITGYAAEEVIGLNPSVLKSSAQDPSFYEKMWETITRGDVWRGTLVDRRKDGSFYPAMMSVAPILDEAGRIRHYVAVQQDMSEYKRLEQQFHRAQKMDALGRFVGGIAHDFNNMLAGVVGNIYLLRRRIGDHEGVAGNLDTIERLCAQATSMIKQMLTYARADQVEPKAFAFNDMVDEALSLSEAAIPENIVRVIETDAEPLYVHGDSNQLQQAIINILHNARDAVEGRADGAIRCQLETFMADDGFRQRHPDCPGEVFAHLSVADNGCGIPEALLDRIFDPFFTTKGVDKGNGLGLAMVYGAVENHHGAIEVESEPERGSTFHVYLPLADTTPEQPMLPAGNDDGHGGGELIIVADDELHVRQMYAELLPELGYRVETAENGEEAVRIYEAHQSECAMVILDVVMPKMGGVEVAGAIRRQNSRIPILFATGYDRDVSLARVDEGLENCHVIGKPFQVDRLMQAIQQMIAST